MNLDLDNEVARHSGQTFSGDKEAAGYVKKLSELIINTLDEKNADDIELLRVAEKTSLADYFILATARNSSHSKVLADAVEEAVLKNLGQSIYQSEGLENRKWVVLDYGDLILHIMLKEDRQFYNLERLWQE